MLARNVQLFGTLYTLDMQSGVDVRNSYYEKNATDIRQRPPRCVIENFESFVKGISMMDQSYKT